MGPDSPLPIGSDFTSAEAYVDELLDFVTSSDLLRTLCGGVHILDFFTRDPELFSVVIKEEWRKFFRAHDIMDILDLLMRQDLDEVSDRGWRNGPTPPSDLIDYITTIRRLSLRRDFNPIGNANKQAIARDVARGMNVKKVHEVDHFSRYVAKLTDDIAEARQEPVTHLVDFGTGQGYLPRCLASPPFNKHLIAIESKQSNIDGAMAWDMQANLAEKPKIMRNKKEWRAERDTGLASGTPATKAKGKPTPKGERGYFFHPGEPDRQTETEQAAIQISNLGQGSIQYVEHWIWDGDLSRVIKQIVDPTSQTNGAPPDSNAVTRGSNADSPSRAILQPSPSLCVISLHSCGNLIHHGIRSLLLNPSVSSIALIGCCYNLLTTRLGPPTHKLPSLRSANARLSTTNDQSDPHGFPMSARLCNYRSKFKSNRHSHRSDSHAPNGQSTNAETSTSTENDEAEAEEVGLRLNITARMMAVQAPQNWGRADSASFFTRHFFRALLQRIFLDLGLVSQPTPEDEGGDRSPLGWTGGATLIPDEAAAAAAANNNTGTSDGPDGKGGDRDGKGDGQGTTPIVIGGLKKAAYKDFVSYLRAATDKIVSGLREPEISVMTPDLSDPQREKDRKRADVFEAKLGGLSDEDIRDYERVYGERKKDLSVLWSLMAFSAGVIEATIVVDRWLFLKEHGDVVEKAWVEPVFDYRLSPRNLVVVGVKRRQ